MERNVKLELDGVFEKYVFVDKIYRFWLLWFELKNLKRLLKSGKLINGTVAAIKWINGH